MQSLLILPLLVRDAPIGTLALAAHRPEAFGNHVRPALSALAAQLAVALSNAESVRRLEELADHRRPDRLLQQALLQRAAQGQAQRGRTLRSQAVA